MKFRLSTRSDLNFIGISGIEHRFYDRLNIKLITHC